MAAALQEPVVRLLLLSILASAFYIAKATDPSQLQDYCVADLNSQITINGFPCKSPQDLTSEDFFFNGLAKPGNTDNFVGSAVTTGFVAQYAALNTLGISVARIDFAPDGGLNPPHIHPRATELITVIEGKLQVGFVSSNPEHKFFTKVITEGENFVFPKGLIHFEVNVGKTKALAISSLSSQNPGIITIANATFGSNPLINASILAKAFQIDIDTVKELEAKFSKNN